MIRLRTQKLLSGVSALAALMTFGAVGAQAAGTTISGPGVKDAINTQTDTTAGTRDFVTIDTNADVGVDGSGRSFYNPRTTPGLISIGSGSTGLLVQNSTLEGSIENGGVIFSSATNAINLDTSVVLGGIKNSGSIYALTGDDGIQVNNSTLSGGIYNTLDAEIRASDDGIFIESDSVVTGGITNAGLIASTTSGSGSGTSGFGNGINITSGVSFSGGIINTINGEIRGGGAGTSENAIRISADSFTGGISNSGLIDGQGPAGDGILITGDSFQGGIINDATGEILTIGSIGNAIEISGGSFEGGISNAGLIDARVASGTSLGVFTGGVGIDVVGEVFSGGINNSGSILSDTGPAIQVAGGLFDGGIANSGSIVSGSGTGILVSGDQFNGGITNTVDGLIQGSNDAILIDGRAFTGGISNAGSIVSQFSTAIAITGNSFEGGINNAATGVIKASDIGIYINSNSFSGGITNAGLIEATGSSNAIDIVGDSFSGGIVNSGSIIAQGVTTVAAAIQISGTDFSGGISNSGLIEGGSVNGAIDILGNTFEGGIQNSGSIIGDGRVGIYVGAGSDTFTGGISNETGGVINADSVAIEINGTSFSGGISNAGVIGATTSAPTTAIRITGSSFAGGIHNSGTIAGSTQGINITNTVNSFTGGITNDASGLIESTNNNTAVQVAAFSFSGGISNSGSILGDTIAINLDGGAGSSFAGGIHNEGEIASANATATAILITTQTFSGGITNTSSGRIISGTQGGLIADFDAILINNTSFSGGIVNDGLIQGGTNAGKGIDEGASTFVGGISNTGTIQGGATGLYIHGNSFSGGLVNEGGTIRATESGIGVNIQSNTFSGGVSNSGLIKGVPGTTNTNGTGLWINSTTFTGGVVNSGTISGDDPGLLITASNFSGGVSNSGLISGTSDDGARLSGTNFTGGFVNSGSIVGSSDGVDISYTNFSGGFTNTADGAITGSRGVRIGGTNFHGDVLNQGLIDGGEGEGLRLDMTLLAGNVTNEGEIIGTGDGLHIDGVTTVNGNVSNSGTITSSVDGDGVDVRGHVQGNFSNSGLIFGGTDSAGLRVAGKIDGNIFNSGSIISAAGIGIGAVNLAPEGQAHELTQTAGLISDGGEGAYAIKMTNGFDDTFFANGGVVEGDILASAGDDMITQSGTFAWAYGTTGVTKLDQFDVNTNGTSILGSYTRGDGFGGIVTVDAASMALDGHLHLGDFATVNVDSIAQSATGQVEYFLTSNEGQHGKINVNGVVTNGNLAGKVAVYADAATFADSKFAGQTDFTYFDVVTTTAAPGNFSNAGSILTNSLFFTGESVVDGTNLDINLHRVAFADVLNTDGETQNQNSVGTALDTIFAGGEFSGDFQDLIQGLLANGLTPAEIQAVYDELGGAEHAQLQNTTLGLSGLLGTLIGDRLDATLPGMNGGKSMSSLAFRQYADGTDGKTASDATPPASYGNPGLNNGPSGASVWGRGFGNWTKADGDTEATGYDQNTGGAAIGVDVAVASNATVGLAGSWSTTDVNFNTPGDNAKVDTWQGGLYGSVGLGGFYLDGTATYSSHDLKVDRFVDLPGPATPFVASSNYNATGWSVNGELGHIFRVGRMDLQPSAALSYTTVSTDAFTETGNNNAFNLLVQGADASSLASTLAVRGSGQFMMGRTRVMPDLKLGWRHEFGDDRQTFSAAFEEDPSVPFEIISSKTSADAAVVNAGITAAVTKTIEVFVDLNGKYSGDTTTSNAAGGVRLTW